MATNKKTLLFGTALACALGGAEPSLRADFPSTLAGLKPVGYYRLNTTNAVPAEVAAKNEGSLGAAFDGAYAGLPGRDQPGAIAGDASTAISTYGSGQRVVVPYAADYNPQGPFTVEAWLKPAALDGGLTAPLNAAHMASPRSGWLLYQNGADGWSFRLYNQNGNTFSLELVGGAPVAVDTWYHVVAVYDGTAATLYVNGASVASGSPAGDPTPYVANTDGPFVIGARSDFAYQWKGTADEVAIYTTALSAGDVTAHYQNGTNPNRQTPYNTLVLAKNPAVYYRLGEASLALPVAQNTGSWGAGADGQFRPGTTSALPGPQGPAFTGFETNNLAAGFAGGVVSIPGQSLTTDSATFITWIKRDGNQPARAGIMHQRYTGTPEVKATGLGFQDSGNALSYNWNDIAADYNFNPGFVPPDQEWTFVAVTVTPEDAIMYMGTSAGLVSATNTVTHEVHDFSGCPLELGIDNLDAARAFKGEIDEFAVFDKALDGSQIQALFDSVLPAITLATRTTADPIYEGMTVSFKAATASQTAVTYQWRKDGQPLAGQTKATLDLTNVGLTDSGSYDVVATTGGKTLTSAALPLNVQSGPPIVTKPLAPAVRLLNGKVVFEVVAQGSKPIAYAWKHDGQPIAGETASTLSLSDIQSPDAGTYTVVLTNPYGTQESAASLTVTAPAKYAAAVADGNPVGYWRLDEATGTTAYDSWGGHDGASTAGVTNNIAGPRPATFAGFDAANTAYQFAGEAAKVAIPALNLNKATVTIVAWIYPIGDQVDYAGVVFSRGGTATGLDYTTGQQLGYHWNDTASTYSWSSAMYPSVDQWNFVALVVTPQSGTIYLDSGSGLQSSENTVEHAPASFADPLRIGVDSPDGGRGFKGIIDEVAVYDRALTQAEITALANAGNKGTYNPTPVSIVQQPKGQTIMAGASHTLSAKVTGSVPITYQWQKDGKDLPGAQRSSLSFPSATVADTGVYQLVVKQDTRTVTTTPVTLTVKPVPAYLDLADGLVAHLKFDGNYTDSSGKGNNGTAVGTPAITTGKIGTGALQYSTEVSGGAVSKANYVTLNSPADLQFGGSTSFSVAFWIKFSGAPGDLPFLCNNADSYGGKGFVFAPSYETGSWSWSLNDGTSPAGWPGYAAQYGNDAGYANVLNDGNWHHLAFLVDRADEVTTYCDGVRVHAKSIAGLVFNTDTGLPINIGQGASADYAVAGSFEMDDLGIWRRELTEYDAQAIYVVGSRHGRSFDTTGPAEIRLGIAQTGSTLTLTWTSGTLEAADTVNGTYTAVSGASAPSFTTSATGSAKFYRVRQ